MITILIVILVLMLIGALPSWPHSRNWGYRPSGGLGLILVIILILYMLGTYKNAHEIHHYSPRSLFLFC